MRAAAVFPKEKRFRLVDHDEPRARGSMDVVVRVLEVGLCGTDREIAAFLYGTPPPEAPYLVVGHEALGEVVETGGGVRRLRPGDLVVPTVRRPCHDVGCRACRMGRPEFCQTGAFRQRGIRGAHGYLADRIVDEARFIYAVPRELRDVAVLTQPLSVAEQAMVHIADVQRRLPWERPADVEEAPPEPVERRALVLGAGPVGVLGALALLVRGYRTTIFSREPRGKKAALVESFGIGFASSREEGLADAARRLGSLDVIYEATGAGPLAFEALPLLGPNGVFVFTGIPGRKAPLPREMGALLPEIVLRNQVVLGVTNPGGDAYRAAVEDLGLFARRWPMALPQLVTARHPLEEAGDLLRAPAPAQGIKEVVAVAPLA